MNENLDDAPATQDGTPVAPLASEGGDEAFGQLQDRMASDDDSPWYSSSEGKVVTKDGEIVLNPETKEPFTSEEEFKKWDASRNQAAAKPNDQKPATAAPAEPPKPLSRSFDNFAFGDKGVSADRLFELGNVGKDFQYKDELLPAVDPNAKVEETVDVDPIEQVKAERANLEKVMISPFSEVKQALLDQGADPSLVDQLLAPILDRQRSLVEKHFGTQYEKAVQASLEKKHGSRLSKLEEERLNEASARTIDALSRKYYPEGGKDQFFSLIAGNYDKDGNFVRGTSSVVMDLAMRLSNQGKTFRTEADRNKAYADTFRKMTSDPTESQILFDIAHHYMLGRKLHEAQKTIYAMGKQSAKQEAQRVQKTIKTRPASYAAPVSEEDSRKGMPSMLRMAMYGEQ